MQEAGDAFVGDQPEARRDHRVVGGPAGQPLRAETERLRADAQAKIAQLQERIKELNQKLMSGVNPAVKR